MEKITNEVTLTEKKVNKKGFSLVELIVVIAIMAILVGIVGMQVLPYIERSRESNDIQALDNLCTAAVSAFSMNAEALTPGDYTIDGAGLAAAPDDAGGDAVVDTIRELMGDAAAASINALIIPDIESREGDTADSVQIAYDGDTGIITVSLVTAGGDVVLEPVTSR